MEYNCITKVLSKNSQLFQWGGEIKKKKNNR